jgi:hypothetical protein
VPIFEANRPLKKKKKKGGKKTTTDIGRLRDLRTD